MQKKWAFVSDYARFKILYEYGGVYLDADVELLKPLDEIIEKGPFMGIEKFKGISLVAPGLGLGVNAGLGLYKEILDLYDTTHFIKTDGSYNLYTVVQYVTDILCKHGFVKEDKKQEILGVTIYPSEYFDPMDCETSKISITKNTVSIHHYACSWMDEKVQRKKKFQKIIGPEITGAIIKLKRKWRTK